MSTTQTPEPETTLFVVRTRSGNETHLNVSFNGGTSSRTMCGCRAAGRVGGPLPGNTREDFQAARAAVTCERC